MAKAVINTKKEKQSPLVTYRVLDHAIKMNGTRKKAAKHLGIPEHTVKNMLHARSGVTLCLWSDTHTGHRTGLNPDGVVKHPQGGAFQPSGWLHEIQKEHFKAWRERIELYYEQGRKTIGVFGGDAIEAGTSHHRQRAGGGVWSNEPREEVEAAIALHTQVRPLFQEYYFVRGTESHVANYENRIAEAVGAVPNPYDNVKTHTFDVLQLEINKMLFRFAHHGAGIGSKEHTKTNSIQNQLKDIWLQSLRHGVRCPDYMIWGHLHRFTKSTFDVVPGMAQEYRQIQGLIQPSWKGIDDYTKRLRQKDIHPFAIGSTFIHIDDSGAITTEPFLKWYDRNGVIEV